MTAVAALAGVSRRAVDRLVVAGFLVMFVLPESPTGPLGSYAVRPADVYLVAVLAPWFVVRCLAERGRFAVPRIPLWLTCMAIVSFASIVWSRNPRETVVNGLQWTEFVGAVFLLRALVAETKDWRWVLGCLLAVIVAVQLLQLVTILEIKLTGYERYRFIPDIGVVGALTAAAFAAAVPRSRGAAAVLLAVFAVIVLISFNRTGVLAVLLGASVMVPASGVRLPRAAPLVIVVGVVSAALIALLMNSFYDLWSVRVSGLFALLHFDLGALTAQARTLDAGVTHRLAGVLIAKDIWLQHPYTGVGAGVLEKLAGPEAFAPFNVDYAAYARLAPYSADVLVVGHSYFMTTLAELGILGIVPFTLALLAPVRAGGGRGFPRAIAAGYAIAAFVYALFNPPGVTTYLLLLVATAAAAAPPPNAAEGVE